MLLVCTILWNIYVYILSQKIIHTKKSAWIPGVNVAVECNLCAVFLQRSRRISVIGSSMCHGVYQSFSRENKLAKKNVNGFQKKSEWTELNGGASMLTFFGIVPAKVSWQEKNVCGASILAISPPDICEECTVCVGCIIICNPNIYIYIYIYLRGAYSMCRMCYYE